MLRISYFTENRYFRIEFNKLNARIFPKQFYKFIDTLFLLLYPLKFYLTKPIYSIFAMAVLLS